MKLKSILLLTGITLLFGCSSKLVVVDYLEPPLYFPSVINNIRLSANFQMVDYYRPRAVNNYSTEEEWSKYTENVDDKNLNIVTYYFDSKEPYMLRKVYLEYFSTLARDRASESLYGEPNFNDGKEWMLTGEEKFDIHIMHHENKIIIEGLIPMDFEDYYVLEYIEEKEMKEREKEEEAERKEYEKSLKKNK